ARAGECDFRFAIRTERDIYNTGRYFEADYDHLPDSGRRGGEISGAPRGAGHFQPADHDLEHGRTGFRSEPAGDRAMTDWEKQNNQYLAASLDWLRVRVQKFIVDDGSLQPQPTPGQAAASQASKSEPPGEAPAERQPGRLARWLNPTASKPAIAA